MELVHLVALEGYKVPDTGRTLFDLAVPDTEDIAGCWDSGTRFGTDDDTLDFQDDQDNHRAVHTLKGAVVVVVAAAAAAAVGVVVVEKAAVEVDEADSRDVHLYCHNAVDRRTDCWRQYSLLHVAEDSRDSGRWGIHPSMELGALLPKTGTNPDCWMTLPATARLF